MLDNDCYGPEEINQPFPRSYRSTPEWQTAIQLGHWVLVPPVVLVGAVVADLLFDGEHLGDWGFYSQAMMIDVLIGTIITLPYYAVIGLIYREEVELVRWGAIAPAKITDEDKISSRHGKSARLVYRFRDRDGGLGEGRRGNLPVAGPFQSHVADPLMLSIRANPLVLYDPRDSSRNLLYPPNYVAAILPRNPN
jgi:hypothetical protein